jgi:hypothetical protein
MRGPKPSVPPPFAFRSLIAAWMAGASLVTPSPTAP